MYYVKRSMVEIARSSQNEAWYSILELCFDKSHASELKMSLEENSLLNHQSLEYWMGLYVDYIKDMVNNAPMFRNNETMVSEWFHSEGSNNTEIFKDRCINLIVPSSRDIISVLGNIDVFNLSEKSKNHWYHGTIQLNAESIQQEGIMLDEGKEKQDFSRKSGFYLNSEFGGAEEWARKRFQKITGAVLIYEFTLDDFCGLDLSSEESKHLWKNVVEYFRNGSKGGINKDLKKELRKVDYVIGPISTCANRMHDKEYIQQEGIMLDDI